MSIIIDENFDGIGFDEENEEYVFDGEISFKEDVNIKVNLRVNGSIKTTCGISACGSISAVGSIDAGSFIVADGHISATDYIVSGGAIETGEFVKAGIYIDANYVIYARGAIVADMIRAGDISCCGYVNAQSVCICGHTGRNFANLNGLCYPVSRWGDMIRIGCKTYRVEEWRSFSDRQILELDGRRGLAFWKEHKDMILGLLPNEHEVKECCETKTN